MYLVDRRTKQVIWRLGGKKSDLAMGAGTRLYFPSADGYVLRRPPLPVAAPRYDRTAGAPHSAPNRAARRFGLGFTSQLAQRRQLRHFGGFAREHGLVVPRQRVGQLLHGLPAGSAVVMGAGDERPPF